MKKDAHITSIRPIFSSKKIFFNVVYYNETNKIKTNERRKNQR